MLFFEPCNGLPMIAIGIVKTPFTIREFQSYDGMGHFSLCSGNLILVGIRSMEYSPKLYQ